MFSSGSDCDGGMKTLVMRDTVVIQIMVQMVGMVMWLAYYYKCEDNANSFYYFGSVDI